MHDYFLAEATRVIATEDKTICNTCNIITTELVYDKSTTVVIFFQAYCFSFFGPFNTYRTDPVDENQSYEEVLLVLSHVALLLFHSPAASRKLLTSHHSV
jgi:hypothetical protein